MIESVMVEKKLFEQLIKRLKRGTVTVHYWDGKTKEYGYGEPHADMTITDPKVVRAMFKNVSLGAGEAYMDKSLLLEPLDAFLNIMYLNIDELIEPIQKLNPQSMLSRNTRKKQADYIEHHYDLGNDFYKLWLDNDTMAYTCAYFRTPNDTLEMAQSQKMDHVLRKLQLQKGMEIAELGCGWGRLLIRAAKKSGVSGVGVTLSREQHKYANEQAKKEGVDHLVHFELMNYQELAEQGKQYDRVYSVGLFEHVGRGNQNEYFTAVDTLLKPGGISFLHCITSQVERTTDAWTDKYIFPGGHIHSVSGMVSYLPPYHFRLLDYESLRLHYALTLDEWWRRFEEHKDEVIAMFDERFYLMWRFWLAASSANFRYGEMDLSQLVFSKGINNELPLTREHIYKKD